MLCSASMLTKAKKYTLLHWWGKLPTSNDAWRSRISRENEFQSNDKSEPITIPCIACTIRYIVSKFLITKLYHLYIELRGASILIESSASFVSPNDGWYSSTLQRNLKSIHVQYMAVLSHVFSSSSFAVVIVSSLQLPA